MPLLSFFSSFRPNQKEKQEIANKTEAKERAEN
jgi:hypothetical protein